MILELLLQRVKTGDDSTLGVLVDASPFQRPRMLCYTLEDEHREVKVPGETRIPAGLYSLGLRTVGGFHARYSKRFPNMHEGMIQVLDVPEFEYILFHCGNTDDDTAGCILLGDEPNGADGLESSIHSSTKAYRRVYPLILQRMKIARAALLRVVDVA